MKNKINLIAVLLTLILSGCAPFNQPAVLQYEVRSNPAGATATIDNRISGVTPFVTNFNLTKEQANGTAPIYLGEVSVRWISGATTSRTVTTNIIHGHSQYTLFDRPNAPGLETDANYAVQQQNLALQQQQIRANAAIQYLQIQQQQQMITNQNRPVYTTCSDVWNAFANRMDRHCVTN